MNLNVEVNGNLISLTSDGGNIFNMEINNSSSYQMENFVNFIQSEMNEYESNCKYKLLIYPDTDAECPREWDNIGTMIGFHRSYIAGDNHSYSSQLELMYDLAYEYDSNNTEDLEELYNEDKMSKSDYFEKLSELADKNNVILPVYLLDHSIVQYSTHDFNDRWDSGQVGFIYASYDKIKSEFGDISEESIEKAKNNLEGEVKTYSQWANGEVYGFRLIKVDEFDNEVEEIDSCWGFYGPDIKENGIKDHIPKEFEYLLDEAEFKC